MKKFLLIAMLFGVMSAKAQTSIEQEQAAQIAQLQEEVADLKKRGTAWDKITKALPKVSGYTQVRYDYKDGDGGSSTFQLRRVRLSLDGNISPKLDYKLQLELTAPNIVDAYFSYKPLAGLKVRVGQYKVPFSIENTDYGPTKLELIDYSLAISYLVGNSDAADKKDGANGRDIGIKLYGDLFDKVLSYDLGVFNGAGINCKDNNSSKDFIARLIVRPFKGFAVTGSYMYSKTQMFDYDVESPRWAVGALYESRHWIARSEFAQADFGDNITNAFYVLGGYHFDEPWSVFARYEFLNDRFTIMDRERFGLGTAYKPFKFLRLQFNLTYEKLNDMPKDLRNNFGANLMVTAIF
jgi:hypothetical protein